MIFILAEEYIRTSRKRPRSDILRQPGRFRIGVDSNFGEIRPERIFHFCLFRPRQGAPSSARSFDLLGQGILTQR
jgi:hypothetical protein